MKIHFSTMLVLVLFQGSLFAQQESVPSPPPNTEPAPESQPTEAAIAVLRPPIYRSGYSYRIRTKLHSEMSLDRADQEMAIEMELLARCEAYAGSKSNRRVTISVEKIKAKLDLARLTMEFDSTEHDQDDSLLTTFAKLLENPFRFYLSETGEVVEIGGVEEFDETNPLSALFSVEDLQKMLMPRLNPGIAADGQALGSSWSHESAENGVKSKSDIKYLRDEEKDGKTLAVLEANSKLSFQLTGGGGEDDTKITAEASDGHSKSKWFIDKQLRFPQSGETQTSFRLKVPNPARAGAFLSMPVKQRSDFELISAASG